jgi:hypothetical protein
MSVIRKAIDVVWEELYSPITQGQRNYLLGLLEDINEYDEKRHRNLPTIIVKKDYKDYSMKYKPEDYSISDTGFYGLCYEDVENYKEKWGEVLCVKLEK